MALSVVLLFFIAFKKKPSVIKMLFFCHSSAEQGHQK
jgi:nicotinate-nucleotide--dimethylbenzimidazole phosphoribosyltransferase